MRRSHNAEYDAELRGTKSTRNGCMGGTSERTLQLLSDWAEDDGPPVFFLSGMAGMGKTTIAYTFCERLQNQSQPYCHLAANFFCSRELPGCGDLRLIIPTIAFQLARFSRAFATALIRALQRDPACPEKRVEKQLLEMLEVPWKETKDLIFISSNNGPLIIVIDALDECEESSQLIDVLLVAIRDCHLPGIKVLLTSRPQPDIVEQFSHPDHQTLRLHDLDKEKFNHDIRAYISSRLSWPWVSPADVEALVQHSSGLWIYAATVIKYVSQSGAADRRERLRTILQGSSSLSKYGAEPLDSLYRFILETQTRHLDDLNTEARNFEAVLDTLVCSKEPLSIDSIACLLEFDSARVRDFITCLASIYYLDDKSNLVPVIALHASFGDFMTNPQRSSITICTRLENHHIRLARRCFEIMKDQLKFNICGLQSSFLADEEVPDLQERIERNISAALQYSCSSWAYHLDRRVLDPNYLDVFMLEELLFWIEVMNIIKLGRECGGILRRARIWADVRK